MKSLNKGILVVILSAISQINFSQNINTILPNFYKTGMQSDILYNPSSISNNN
jgi:hypothetical protein